MKTNEKIIMILPYRKLSNIASEVIEELGINIPIKIGGMSEGVLLAKTAKKDGKEIIISRGGTAKLIRENVDLPVVEIKVTGYDLLGAIYKYKNNKANFGVAGYSNIIRGSKAIADTLGLNLNYIIIEKEEDAYNKIREAAAEGINIIIGDTVATSIAHHLGLEYELIESGRESVIEAICEAKDLYEAIMNERKHKEQIKMILDFSNEGIIAVDQKGMITQINPTAKSLFDIKFEEVVGKPIDRVIPDIEISKVLKTKQKELGSIHKTKNAIIATNMVPILIDNLVFGAVATFQDITKITELEQKIRQKISSKGLVAKYTFDDIIGESDSISKAVNLAKRYGSTDSTVLILGESGTGKELFAQSMHNISKRKNNPFVAINCAALPGDLLESELFGYEEGAFTGARKGGKKGLFELAHNGTIFLDEVGEMDPKVQSRILRVIQEKEIMPLGSDKVIPINTRIIAATNRLLTIDVDSGRFRKDLYYRLNVLSIEVPPLRNRIEDIPQLVDHFVREYSRKHGIKITSVDKAVIQELQKYDWPGNVRELQNILEKLVVISDQGKITKDFLEIIDFPPIIYQHAQQDSSSSLLLEGTLDDIINKVIENTLKEENFNKTRTAKRLGIDRTTLQRRLNKLTK
jgi:PAS domain S-box-containing protein